LTHVSLQNLSKIYPGTQSPALDNLSLEIPTGELTALLGPSGCGKTTAMKMIAGLLEPSSGDITFDGKSVLDEKPEDRGAVMVFQNYLLFPYMSVAENIGFGLKMRKTEPEQIKKRVGKMLDLVKLPDLGNRKPSELSGGQQQRVALARALIIQPDVLLLDEPLSNLDAHLRLEMRDLIRSLQQEMKITTIFVTHDQEEAVVLADKIALILDGKMKQYDTPQAFYNTPIDEATARFFGSQNFVHGTAQNGIFNCPLGKISIPKTIKDGKGALTFRPENVQITKDGSKENTFAASVDNIIYLGTQTRLKLKLNDIEIDAIVNPREAQSLSVGDEIKITLPSEILWKVS
jgi:ABC-type Fe3+/spermidine/putrescine transport system ATPase subunit